MTIQETVVNKRRLFRSWPAAVVAAVVPLGASGCTGGSTLPQHTITEHQAITQAEQILRDTASAITPRPTLELSRLLTDTGPCLVDPTNTADTRVQVSRAYYLRGFPRQGNASVAQQVLAYWQHKGYAISDTQRMNGDTPAIHGATSSGDFTISLDTGGDGTLTIGATSPCLWPNGTPPAGS
ncbi:MAG TPA: hypothetical protein VLW44_02885 [Streptosporangiaceae bacterium]|nr:hypothetical protein [Streptosporangiaceae bacterium]